MRKGVIIGIFAFVLVLGFVSAINVISGNAVTGMATLSRCTLNAGSIGSNGIASINLAPNAGATIGKWKLWRVSASSSCGTGGSWSTISVPSTFRFFTTAPTAVTRYKLCARVSASTGTSAYSCEKIVTYTPATRTTSTTNPYACGDKTEEGVYLTDLYNSGGACVKLPIGQYQNLGNVNGINLLNDRASSIKIVGNYRVIVYSDSGFAGPSQEFSSSDLNLAGNIYDGDPSKKRSINNDISSVKIESMSRSRSLTDTDFPNWDIIPYCYLASFSQVDTCVNLADGSTLSRCYGQTNTPVGTSFICKCDTENTATAINNNYVSVLRGTKDYDPRNYICTAAKHMGYPTKSIIKANFVANPHSPPRLRGTAINNLENVESGNWPGAIDYTSLLNVEHCDSSSTSTNCISHKCCDSSDSTCSTNYQPANSQSCINLASYYYGGWQNDHCPNCMFTDLQSIYSTEGLWENKIASTINYNSGLALCENHEATTNKYTIHSDDKCKFMCNEGFVTTDANGDGTNDGCCLPSCAGVCGGSNGCGGTCPNTCSSNQQCDPNTYTCIDLPTGGAVGGVGGGTILPPSSDNQVPITSQQLQILPVFSSDFYYSYDSGFDFRDNIYTLIPDSDQSTDLSLGTIGLFYDGQSHTISPTSSYSAGAINFNDRSNKVTVRLKANIANSETSKQYIVALFRGDSRDQGTKQLEKVFYMDDPVTGYSSLDISCLSGPYYLVIGMKKNNNDWLVSKAISFSISSSLFNGRLSNNNALPDPIPTPRISGATIDSTNKLTILGIPSLARAESYISRYRVIIQKRDSNNNRWVQTSSEYTTSSTYDKTLVPGNYVVYIYAYRNTNFNLWRASSSSRGCSIFSYSYPLRIEEFSVPIAVTTRARLALRPATTTNLPSPELSVLA